MFTLIDNAVKYSSAGTKILVSAHQADDGIIQIAVEDEGQTIPRDKRERVFDKFFRATRDGDASGSIQPKGTGMGLAVAKGIVEAHGGVSGLKTRGQELERGWYSACRLATWRLCPNDHRIWWPTRLYPRR